MPIHFPNTVTLGLGISFVMYGILLWRLNCRLSCVLHECRFAEAEMQRVLKDVRMRAMKPPRLFRRPKKQAWLKAIFSPTPVMKFARRCNAILGMTRLLLDSALDSRKYRKSWAQIVFNSGENLLNITTTFWICLKIEADQLNLANDTCDLYRAMAESVDLMISKAEQKNISLMVDIAANVPRYVMGDALRLKHITLLPPSTCGKVYI